MYNTTATHSGHFLQSNLAPLPFALLSYKSGSDILRRSFPAWLYGCNLRLYTGEHISSTKAAMSTSTQNIPQSLEIPSTTGFTKNEDSQYSPPDLSNMRHCLVSPGKEGELVLGHAKYNLYLAGRCQSTLADKCLLW